MIEYRLKLAGCDCAVVEWNPSGSIVVLAFHGWLDNLATFESLVNHMPEVRLIAVDFPGHGHSGHLPNANTYHFVDGVYLIDDLAAHFKLEKLNILGHSMGAAVACLYAGAKPEKVRGLVLIESLGPLTTEAEGIPGLIRQSLIQRRLLIDKRKPVYKNFEQALDVRAEVSQIEKSLIKPLVERALVNVETGGYTWRADSKLRISSTIRLSEVQLQQVLSQIEAPVLMFEAESGLLAENALMQKRKKDFKRLTVSQLAGGHHVHLEQPQSCGNEIQAFFEKID